MKIQIKENQLREVVVSERCVCDKCGEDIVKNTYDAFSFELSYQIGDCYPEGGSGEKWELDLCQDCAVKAKDLLKNNGYRFIESDWDY